MRILFDHCVPKPFRRELPAHAIKTAAEMGWEELNNGELMAAASVGFDVFLTVDKNMKYEQDLDALPLAVVILDAIKNTPELLAPYAPYVDRVLPTLRRGQMIEIDAAGNVLEIAPGR